MRRFVFGALLLALVLAFALFVWPTPWRYDHMTVDGDIVPVRIHRVGGAAEMLLPDEGWIPVQAPDGAAQLDPVPS